MNHIYSSEKCMKFAIKRVNQGIEQLNQKSELTASEKVSLINLTKTLQTIRTNSLNTYKSLDYGFPFFIPGVPKENTVSFDRINRIRKNLKTKGYLFPDEINILLEWLGYQIHVYLHEYLNQNFKNATYEKCCWMSSEIAKKSLEFLNIPMIIYDMGFTNNAKSHEFCIAKFPVKKEYGIEQRKYILDYTFRQFLSVKKEDENSYIINTIYQEMKLCEFFLKLVQKGFFEMNDETVKSYFKPLILTKNVKDYNYYIPQETKILNGIKPEKELMRLPNLLEMIS